MGQLWPEREHVGAECATRGIEVYMLKTNPNEVQGGNKGPLKLELTEIDAGPEDVVAGFPGEVECALEYMGIPVPDAADYPDCLSHLIRRRTWPSTLREVEESLRGGLEKVFVKSIEAKRMQAHVFDQQSLHPQEGTLCGMFGVKSRDLYGDRAATGDMPVFCSDVLEINKEYAVYAVDGTVRAICRYGPEGDPALELDYAMVEEAVAKMATAEPAMTGYRMDFMLAKKAGEEAYTTELCEVNDGYVAGSYEGISAADYTDMVISRFRSLQGMRA